MKLSESWLREWVNPNVSHKALSDALTMAGFEVEEIEPVAKPFSNVVIGEVVEIKKHPEADRLQICIVNIGKKDFLEIVCGAKNVKKNMKVAVALIGAALPNDLVIKPAKIRGIPSEGMLCSAEELGLIAENEGLLELPIDAPLGENIRNYLLLDDHTFDISITPNRGDCLSVRGMAREVAAITQSPLNHQYLIENTSKIKDKFPVKILANEACPCYVGRIIRNCKNTLTSPIWLKERLRRSGIRSISPIVDVTNYVMLELGQPLHAFDLNLLNKEIIVRLSKKGESIKLLDDSTKELNDKTLVIADQEKLLAIAGVMGGLDSSVTLTTTDIFLESAYFIPEVVARQRQYYNLNSDSAYRFERGIDPTIQRQAIERASELILKIVGGEAGEIVEVKDEAHFAIKSTIDLSFEKIQQVLGLSIPNEAIESIFNALQFTWHKEKNHWQLTPPPYRNDINLAEDVIEEIARLYGYDKIPTHHLQATLNINQKNSQHFDDVILKEALSHQGYHEVISYSFIDETTQSLFDHETPQKLLNPITAEMSVMRTNLWPGLISTLEYNKSRQQQRIRLFELGTCFLTHQDKLLQSQRLGGLITGNVLPDQWGVKALSCDFYDLKNEIENILGLLMNRNDISYQPDRHTALHPGQTAGIYSSGKKIGIMGALHPSLLQQLDLKQDVFVFEIDINSLKKVGVNPFKEISKFPEIRRDLALVVDRAIPSKDIQDTIKQVAGNWLKESFVFDVYQGKGITPGLKSIALALILQHPTRTLVDEEVAALMQNVTEKLKERFKAELRS